MKKIIIMAIVTIIACITLVGCGNNDVFNLNHTYDKAIISVGGEWMTIEIETWCIYEDNLIQVKAKDGSTYLVHSSNCTLIHSSR